MARLDAILGRGDDAPPQTSGDKGSNKGFTDEAVRMARADIANGRSTKGPA
jgi:hypothetical protein